MAGGRFRCLSCLLAYTAALLLGVSRHDVEAAEGKQVIHKRVGDSVELLSNLPAEGVTSVEWRYKNTRVAIKGSGVIRNNPFNDRAKFNNITFSLTIRDLTLQDSGEFNLITEVKDHPGSVFITLQVHEPISTNPNVFSNITQPGPNGFCTVFLECKANPHSNVTYIWTVGNQRRCGFSPVMFWFRLVVGLLVILVLVWLLYDAKLKEVFCSRFKHDAAVDQDLSQPDLHSSPPPSDALVYEDSGGSADA